MGKKDGFLSLVKGFIAGIGSLIPGISSGSLIVSLSSFENFVTSLANVFKKKDRKLTLITIPLIVGIIVGLLAGFHLANYFLANYKPQTVFLFVGLISGGYMLLIKNEKLKFTKKLTLLFLLVFIFVLIGYVLIFDKISFNIPNYLIPIISGIITALAFVVPAFSISLFYLMLDKYEYVISSFRSFSSFEDFMVIVVFVISIIVSLVLVSKLIYFVINKYRKYTFIVICSLMTASVVITILEMGKFTINFVNIFTSILTFLWGYLLAKNLEKE